MRPKYYAHAAKVAWPWLMLSTAANLTRIPLQLSGLRSILQYSTLNVLHFYSSAMQNTHTSKHHTRARKINRFALQGTPICFKNILLRQQRAM